MAEVTTKEEKKTTETEAMIVEENMTIDATGVQEIMTTEIEIETVSIIAAAEEDITREIESMVETLEDKKEEDLTIERIKDPTGQAEQVEVMVEEEGVVEQEGVVEIPQ